MPLRSRDFNKSGKLWTTNAIDLYHNEWYTNYSVKRSRHGLNLIGDNTFVGTEIVPNATPTVIIDGSTPVYVTNYGEVIVEQNAKKYNIFQYDELAGQYFIFNLEDASPFFTLQDQSDDLYRFVDTSSRIDIIRYKRRIFWFNKFRSSDFYNFSI